MKHAKNAQNHLTPMVLILYKTLGGEEVKMLSEVQAAKV